MKCAVGYILIYWYTLLWNCFFLLDIAKTVINLASITTICYGLVIKIIVIAKCFWSCGVLQLLSSIKSYSNCQLVFDTNCHFDTSKCFCTFRVFMTVFKNILSYFKGIYNLKKNNPWPNHALLRLYFKELRDLFRNLCGISSERDIWHFGLVVDAKVCTHPSTCHSHLPNEHPVLVPTMYIIWYVEDIMTDLIRIKIWVQVKLWCGDELV